MTVFSVGALYPVTVILKNLLSSAFTDIQVKAHNVAHHVSGEPGTLGACCLDFPGKSTECRDIITFKASGDVASCFLAVAAIPGSRDKWHVTYGVSADNFNNVLMYFSGDFEELTSDISFILGINSPALV